MTALPAAAEPGSTVGALLRRWRERRRLSQLELASRADVSSRHVSFVETGRSQPTRAMILRLADQLDVPLRERNTLLVSGGFAPVFPQEPLDAPSMAMVSGAMTRVLDAHQPYPALVVDRRWELVAANDAVAALLEGVAPDLVEPPANVLRLTLHPDGLAPRIVNLAQWRGHLLGRLERDVRVTGDTELEALLDELRGYPAPPGEPAEPVGLVVPIRLRVGQDVWSMFSTTTVFGTPHEVTVSELAIEAFYPADEASERLLRGATAVSPLP